MRPVSPSYIALTGGTILIVAMALLSATAIHQKCPTMDESLHAVGGYAHAFAGDYHINPEDPPLWKYWAMLPHRADELKYERASGDYSEIFTNTERQLWFCAGALYRTPGVDGVRFINRSRIPMLVIPALLAAALMLFAWRAGGIVACLIAGSLLCLDPNFLAHGPLLKNDVAITLLMFALAYSTWRLGQRITIGRLMLVVLLCALGPCVKFSGVIFLPLLALMLLVRAVLTQPWPALKRELNGRSQRTGAAIGICILAAGVTWIAIWASYGFRYAPSRDASRQMDFQPQVTSAIRHAHFAKHGDWPAAEQMHALAPPLPVRGILWASDNRLLPQSWLYGLLYTYQSSLFRPAYLLGEVRMTGWWYYFPLTMLFKTPVATLAAISLGLVASIVWIIKRGRAISGEDRWLVACIGIPILLYGMIAMRTNLNLGLRHVLPLYPFLFLIAGIVVARLAKRARRIGMIGGIGIAVLLAVESIAAWPDYIPFFNVAFGGQRGGITLLGDSNLDWGQDLPALGRWREENPSEKLYLCYFGSVDPAYYGIKFTNLPSGYFLEPHAELPKEPGVIAVSATKLQGLYVYPNVLEFYESLRQIPPREVLNGTVYLFDFPPKRQFDPVR